MSEAPILYGKAWRRRTRTGGTYLAGYLPRVGRIVVWLREGERVKGEAHADIELHLTSLPADLALSLVPPVEASEVRR
jgi:hypothetical protein